MSNRKMVKFERWKKFKNASEVNDYLLSLENRIAQLQTDLERALKRLDSTPSWCLSRISPNTYSLDISDIRVGKEIQGLIRSGKAFRCRIGRGAWYYSSTAEEAAQQAIAALQMGL